MIKTLIILLTMMFVSIIMMTLYQIINKKTLTERDKMSPFECGFDPKSSSRLPFSTQFFLIGILFLIFDVEMVMIMPMVITLKKSNLTLWFTTSTLMMMILIMGLYYEWKNGAIEWIS
uniref:NADH-ubiquinone oxidoreductase chain 3 n=1 Tax=Cysteochila chiniana TaxID=2172476 RepID=A0A343WNL5_9HEMI|nr:NADH dehydrogenase subunit 3 [Cysteochila chiniana]AWD31591.1 NADH dehydrogenase subunit 3 [Cysteochila chiniana]